MSRIAVAGAGGFIGRHICAHLTASGHRVTALLGPPDTITPVAERMVRADIANAQVLDDALAGCEALIHAAGPPSAAASFSDPVTFARVHVAGTAQVMQSAAKAGIARRLLISSAEVYGAPGGLVDEHTPPAPISPYGASKLGGEWIARTIADTAGLTILRPFSLYGGGMRTNSLLGTILGQVRAGTPVRLANLSPVRDYLHVEDLVRLIELTLTAQKPPLILNACSGDGISVRSLAQTVLLLAGRKDQPVANGTAERPRDVDALVGNNEAAMTTLGWVPGVMLEDGLAGLLAS